MNALPWHAAAWQRLREQRERGAVPHALLLAGPRGLGKREFLERLLRALLCEQNADGDACGRCKACRLLEAGTHPDRVRIELELNSSGNLRKEIVVEQIRALGARLSKASQFGGWQVASIDPADAMNKAAANALLKTLEEPGPSSLLVLVANAPWRLPATIRSRCQRIDLHLPETDEALAWLREQGVEHAAEALAAAAGSPGLAREWAEQGLLDEHRAVGSDLAALARGQADVYAVMKRWTDADLLDQRLWFAAQWAADERRARAGGQKPRLGSQLEDEPLLAWYERANRARESLRGPLRADLVVLELLERWR